MKKVLSVLFVIFMLVLLVSVSASAATRHVYDRTGTMTSEQISRIEKTCREIKEEYSFDVIYVITNTIGSKTIERYSTDIYDEVCECEDGVIFVFNTEEFGQEDEDNWAFIGFGKGKRLAGNSSTREALISKMSYDLKRGRDYKSGENFYTASTYLTGKCRSFCEGGFKGDPVDAGQVIVRILIAVVIAMLIALAITNKEKKKLTTAVKQKGAMNYMIRERSNITVARDIFLYSHTTKVRRESSSSGGGHSYGGTSGGGRSYSGGGGRI